jgi:prepilin-type N-terminal cleavage/methylation domain-containing protein
VSRAGFTLVEVVVALLVAGLVAAAGYGLVAAAADARTAAVSAAAAYVPAPAARAALDGWLRHASLWEGSGPFHGRDRRAGPLPVDELSFPVEDGGALYPGRRRVRLWIERDATRARHGLLAEVAPAAPWTADRTDTLVIAAAAVGMNVRYRSRTETREQWVDGWDSDVVLPDAVELTVHGAPERANDPLGDGLDDVLRIPLAVPLRPAVRAEEVARGRD